MLLLSHPKFGPGHFVFHIFLECRKWDNAWNCCLLEICTIQFNSIRFNFGDFQYLSCCFLISGGVSFVSVFWFVFYFSF
jgi:hypothetical protein